MKIYLFITIIDEMDYRAAVESLGDGKINYFFMAPETTHANIVLAKILDVSPEVIIYCPILNANIISAEKDLYKSLLNFDRKNKIKIVVDNTDDALYTIFKNKKDAGGSVDIKISSEQFRNDINNILLFNGNVFIGKHDKKIFSFFKKYSYYISGLRIPFKGDSSVNFHSSVKIIRDVDRVFLKHFESLENMSDD